MAGGIDRRRHWGGIVTGNRKKLKRKRKRAYRPYKRPEGILPRDKADVARSILYSLGRIEETKEIDDED